MNQRRESRASGPGDARHVVVIGGGVTGLASAYYLRKELGADAAPTRITLLEQSERLGGKLVTEEVDTFLIDGGPDCFLTRKHEALDLCREMGLAEELLATNEAHRGVGVLNRGRLHALPEGVMLIVPTRFMPFALSPLISIPGKLRMALDLLIPPRQEDTDETLGSFVRRRLGPEALDKIAEPLLSGIHVSDADSLSLKSTFPRLMEVERKYGSLTRGMIAARQQMDKAKKAGRSSLPMFMSLRGGMQQITNTLAAQMAPQNIDVRLGSSVEAITRTNGGGPPFQLRLADGAELAADAIVVTTPSNVTSELLRPLDTELSAMLDQIRYVSTAVVSLGYRAGPDMPDFKGFGFIIPKSEGRRITACTFSSVKFEARAPDGHRLLRAFLGGPGREEILNLDDDALVQVVREELAGILGLTAEPVLSKVYRWPKLNPQYDLNHLDHVDDMRQRAAALGPIYLAGCAYDGVGVPDCIRQGKEAAEALVSRFQNASSS